MGAQTPSASSDMPHLNAGFDPDIDKYLDLEQAAVNSSSTSPATSSKSCAGQSSRGSNFGNSQSQQTFSGPSFQYDSYQQQTGLPVGGLANTFALNQATGMQYSGYGNGFIMPMETLNVPLTNLDDFDFNAYPLIDMDLEADSPTDNILYPTAASTKGGLVNPAALLSQENASSGSSAPLQRMYPGMHSELAAQAKAQQAQKQGNKAQQSKRMPQGQRPLPQNLKTQHAKDPHVEESISRLLNQMRQSSVVSAADDESSTPTPSLPHLARLKKDEDEMDEDERLLASEEGKKLSSKERRQLRNKVSARAFRSRRKEYIGQLEGEVALKAQEANDLKVQNRQLMEENRRLTDLTRMLLSSPAFSGFLSELSGTAPSSSATSLPQSQSCPEPQPSQKDVNPHQVARKLQNQQQQVGTAIIPERAIDFSLADTPASSWNTSVGLNNFPVYSLTNVPEGPTLDLEKLCGKADGDRLGQSWKSAKADMPTIEYATQSEEGNEIAPSPYPIYVQPEMELHGTGSLVYAKPSDKRSQASTSPPCDVHQKKDAKSIHCHFNPIGCLVEKDAVVAAGLALMCSRLDAISARIAAVTTHLA